MKIDMIPVNYEKYKSGCEIVSIINSLKYHKYEISLDEFYENFFIHQDWTYDKKNGTMYAPHPDEIYPGDPRIVKGMNCGFGSFGHQVQKSIEQYFYALNCPGNRFSYKYDVNHTVKFEKNVEEKQLKKILDKKIPIIIWSTQASKDSETEYLKMQECGGSGNSWRVTDPKWLDNQTYTWIKGEHCSIVCGYDDRGYILCDPFRGIIKVDRESLNESRKIFDNQIVYFERLHRK